MKILTASLSLLLALAAQAAEQHVYQRDSMGNIQYHKPSFTIHDDGRIIETDSAGNQLYHKQQYQMKDGKVYSLDSVGNIQYHRPSFMVKP